jgi:hypothetical protein
MHKKVTPLSERRIKVRFLNLTLSLLLGYVACKVTAHTTMCPIHHPHQSPKMGAPSLGLEPSNLNTPLYFKSSPY